MRKLKFNQTGDTIVEVMIVLAVLGLAIGISYATANRSLLNSRQAQENSIATELAQAQVEALRPLAYMLHPAANQDVFSAAYVGGFCVKPDNTLQATTSAAPNAACQKDTWYDILILNCKIASDALCGPGGSELRKPDADAFLIHVSWPDVRGNGTDTLQTIYRVHKPS